MRTTSPSLALLVVLAVGGTALAEKAKAKEDSKIYNRAGERGQVVIKVKEGQTMRIDRKEGRWLKVRVSGRTGWIPRSKVEMLTDDDEVVRNTRRRPFVDGRGTKRGFGGGTGPDDRIGADAADKAEPTRGKPAVKDDDEEPDPDEEKGNTDGEEPKDTGDDEGAEVKDDRPKAKVKKKVVAFSEANAESEESFRATPSMVLFPTGKKKGNFIEVETEDGDIGFVLAKDIEVSGGGGGGGDEEDGPSGGPRKKGQIDVRGRLGVTIVQQRQRTAGGLDDRPDNYNLSTSAATIALGGTYLRPYKAAYLVGGELAIDIAKAVPGIKVDAMNTTGITIYNVNARAMIGKDFKRKSGMVAFGRLGFRYYSYQVGNFDDLTKNTAKLPSEIVKAPTIGAALALPKLTEKIGLRFSLDAVLIGASMQQTKGLEDGDATKAKGVMGGVGFTYRWKPSLDINAAYDLNYMKYDFGVPSMTSARGHDAAGTSTGRTDVFHAVTVGVAKAF